MGKISLSVVRDDNSETRKEVAVADADLDRISAALAAGLFPTGVEVSPPSADAEGVPIPAVWRSPTKEELLAAIAAKHIEDLLERTARYEAARAAELARGSVSPISVSS